MNGGGIQKLQRIQVCRRRFAFLVGQTFCAVKEYRTAANPDRPMSFGFAPDLLNLPTRTSVRQEILRRINNGG